MDWIKAHPVVTVGADSSFPPFEYENKEGKVVGLAIAYLDLIAEDTGIQFKIKSSDRWQKFLGELEAGDIMLVSGAVATDKRKEQFHFSRPYAVFPSVIATRDDAHFIGSLKNLTGKKVAVVNGFFEEDILRQDYPQLKLVTYESRREALYAVSTGEAYAYIGNLAIISYLIRSENFDNVQIAAPTPFSRIGLSMAATDPVLIGIINKVLANVTPAKQNALEQEWIAVKYQEVEYLLFGKMGFGLLAALGVAYLWIFSLKNQIKRRKQSEADLSQAKTLAEEALTLAESAKARAEEANARKSEFLGIAAHDLKNPLGSIRGLSEMMIEEIKESPELPPARRNDTVDMLETIRGSADHMLELVNELLDVEALDSGKIHNDGEKLSLHELLRDVIEFNRHAAAKKHIKLDYQCRAQDPTILGDAGRVREILDNLINNAVKYSRPHGMVEATLRFNEDNGMLRVTVKDEGPGLTDADMKTLFGRFSRGSATPTGGESSTGLGLSIVKLMVEELHGRVWAENRTDDKGSQFHAEFPQDIPDIII